MDSVQVRIQFIICLKIPIFLSTQSHQFGSEKDQSECLFEETPHLIKLHNENYANTSEEL